MDAHDITGWAAWAYEVGGWDFWRGLSPTAVSLAESILGAGCIEVRPWEAAEWKPGQLAALSTPAQTRLPHRLGGTEQRSIVLRSRRGGALVEWAICHELGEWLLTDIVRYRGADSELVADMLADLLFASDGAYRQVCGDLFPAFDAVGRVFGREEGWAARRWCLMNETSLALVRRRTVRLKLGEFAFANDEALVELARSRCLPPALHREARGRSDVVLWAV